MRYCPKALETNVIYNSAKRYYLLINGPSRWVVSKKKVYTSTLYTTVVEVYSDSNNKRDKKIYFGSTQGDFKTRYYNHRTSFSHKRYRYSTALSSYVWEIKEKMGVDPIMKWEVIKKCRKYRAGNRTCNLCMEEKLIIADCKSKNMLNKKSEVLNSCKHKRAWLLYN